MEPGSGSRSMRWLDVSKSVRSMYIHTQLGFDIARELTRKVERWPLDRRLRLEAPTFHSGWRCSLSSFLTSSGRC